MYAHIDKGVAVTSQMCGDLSNWPYPAKNNYSTEEAVLGIVSDVVEGKTVLERKKQPHLREI